MSGKPRPGRRAQLVFQGVLLAASVIMLIEAWRIEGRPQWASAGALPLALAAIMLAALLYETFRVWRQAPAKGAFRPYVSAAWLGMVVLTLGFIVLLEGIGFLPAGILFLGAAILFLHRGKPWLALLLALGISALIYALFTLVFKVSLP